jgi:tRNA (guanine37-N1)-methyltransferase
LATNEKMIFICGRYEGIDERIIQSEVDEEWSIGDFVLTGGELAAMTMIDAVSRMIPGVLGTQASAEQDSFADGLLDCPHYTRPEVLDGMAVPKVLLSGNHSKISQYRQKQSLARTLERRPDLLSNLALTDLQEKILVEIVRESRELK